MINEPFPRQETLIFHGLIIHTSGMIPGLCLCNYGVTYTRGRLIIWYISDHISRHFHAVCLPMIRYVYGSRQYHIPHVHANMNWPFNRCTTTPPLFLASSQLMWCHHSQLTILTEHRAG